MAKQAAVKPSTTLRLGTRTSQLALWQTNHVIAQLQQQWPNLQCEVVHLVTQGDRRLDRPLPEIGGKGLFTAELEDALRCGEIDLAVHSLKDLPVEDPEDLIIGAILSREDVRDVIVAREGWTLATLPQGATVGTSSLRRQAQLLAARPDLDVRSIRGNVDTRLRKVLIGEYHAAVMAGAGLIRLGLTEHITEWLAPETMLPAPGQGALAVQCREKDEDIRSLLASIHDEAAWFATRTERFLLERLGGGCSAPIGAWAQVDGDEITLRARIASVDGRYVFDGSATGSEPNQLASEVADMLLAQGALIALSRDERAVTRPLAGKRVVITRPKQENGQGDDLAAQLAKLGALSIIIPAIQLVPTSDAFVAQAAMREMAKYDWVIFTSPNAVEHFWTQAGADSSLPNGHGPKVAAVGPATAAVLHARGITVDAMPAQYLGSEIVATLGDVAGKRILLPRSAQGGRELPTALSDGGALVEEITLYTPTPAPLDDAARTLLVAGVDVVTFASGSAVRAFADSLRADPRFIDFFSKVLVACIGPTTAEVARSEGLPVQIVAAEHTTSGLVTAIVAYYEQGA